MSGTVLWPDVFGKQKQWYTRVGVCVLVTQSCRDSVTPWTVAHQSPLSMEFSRQDYWSG